MYHSDGAVQQVAPIDDRFQLDRVLLRADLVPPEIHIIFRWAREQPVFGVSYVIEQDEDEDETAREVASMIVISLEEDLLACGYGMENAIREPQGDVTWLRWDIKPSAR